MDTLNSTSVLASIIAQNPFHIVSLQGQFPMSHAQNTYDFEIAEEIDYYLNLLEEPETLYTFTEKTINLFKSFIHEN